VRQVGHLKELYRDARSTEHKILQMMERKFEKKMQAKKLQDLYLPVQYLCLRMWK
jgi:hypothetical protein